MTKNQLFFATLPLPPTINSYYQYHGHRRYVGAKGLAFKKEVNQVVTASKVKLGSARLKMTVVINFRDKRKQDISNRIKALEDALVQAGLFDDDSQIDELHIIRGEIVKSGKSLIRIDVLD